MQLASTALGSDKLTHLTVNNITPTDSLGVPLLSSYHQYREASFQHGKRRKIKLLQKTKDITDFFLSSGTTQNPSFSVHTKTKMRGR